MRVKLKVIGGKNDGKEIKILVPEFVIGRGEEAQLRPNSDLVSRRHCAIRISNGTVTIEDLGSRNGTFINGERLTAQHSAVSGDVLRVGQLQFEIGLDITEPSLKRPKVDNVASAAVRARDITPDGGTEADDLDESVSDWLVEDGKERHSTQDTTMLGLDETKSILAEAERKARDKERTRKNRDSDISDSSISEDTSSKRKTPGKLPARPKYSHDTSKVAADDVLRKFFNRR
ncbi:MAG TPA: FHA domain-containing protein [Pirellulaceae bacterium]|nr:FHA domain-containing protein [Pirellulaceae bacterium]